jgi:hypothetical protein
MTRYLVALTLFAATAAPIAAQAQQEGPTPTQALISFDSKTPVTAAADSVLIKVDNRATPVTSLTQLPPNGAQIALLIDDGLRSSMGRELQSLRSFVLGLRPGTEIFVGYMRNGQVVSSGLSGFTTDYAAAAESVRIASGSPGISASPYFCVSDFVKHWPPEAEGQSGSPAPQSTRKAHIILMITNGVDPYNGSTSILNQNSPYVDAAVRDAQAAGVPVYSIYFADSGFRRNRGSFSGQSYLAQVADGTGGVAYYQGLGSPVSTAPYLEQFKNAVADTYIASFTAPGNKQLVQMKASTTLPKTKVRAPSQVRPGTLVQ